MLLSEAAIFMGKWDRLVIKIFNQTDSPSYTRPLTFIVKILGTLLPVVPLDQADLVLYVAIHRLGFIGRSRLSSLLHDSRHSDSTSSLTSAFKIVCALYLVEPIVAPYRLEHGTCFCRIVPDAGAQLQLPPRRPEQFCLQNDFPY